MTHTIGDPMRALPNAALRINPGCINMKDYPHVRRLWMEAYPLLTDRSYADVLTAHRAQLRDAPSEESFDMLVAGYEAQWIAHGEKAFAHKIRNLVKGVHKHWYRGVAEIGGASILRIHRVLDTCVGACFGYSHMARHPFGIHVICTTTLVPCYASCRLRHSSHATGLLPCTQAHERQNREDKADVGSACNGHLYNIMNNFPRYSHPYSSLVRTLLRASLRVSPCIARHNHFHL